MAEVVEAAEAQAEAATHSKTPGFAISHKINLNQSKRGKDEEDESNMYHRPGQCQ